MTGDKNKYKYRKEGDINRRNKKREREDEKVEEDKQTKNDLE